MTKIIGIDLGTSNSAAAVLEGGRPTIAPSTEGVTQYGKAFPSYVAITKDGQRLLGEPARRQAVANPTGTITAFKRKMGTTFKYDIWGKEYKPQELSAFLLRAHLSFLWNASVQVRVHQQGRAVSSRN